MSIHWTRSNDCGSGECFADGSLTGSLGTIELGCRGRRGVEVRYVDQPRNANARGDFSNTPGTVNVYIVKSEISFATVSVELARKDRRRKGERIYILGLIVTANEIVHDIRMANAFCNLFFVANVPFLPSERGKRMTSIQIIKK